MNLSSGFFDALRAPRPGNAREGTRGMYDGLIGSWDAEVVDHLPDGTDRRQSAEMHFAWVLEGRAVQDLWIAPARASGRKTASASGNRYGTTLRVYDEASDCWRITWNNPVAGIENRLVGRRVGEEIVQTGTDAAGRPIRWVFVEIRPDAFHWRGERSEDGGRSWICDTEFFARRRTRASGDCRATWEWTDRPGLETVSIAEGDDSVIARGSVVVFLDDAPLSVRYHIEHDAHWRFREAKIETGPTDAPHELRIRLRERRWEVDGAARADLEGCEDLDLMVTPYTNTPAIETLALAPGESGRLRAAWVRFPELEVRAVEQEYTRLDDGKGEERYRYRDFENGFVGELSLAADGLVVEYGPWKRW